MVVLELGFRWTEARASIREPQVALHPGEVRAKHPNADQPWFQGLPDPVGRLTWGSGLRYDPYRGWWPEPFTHPFVNIDTSGRRVTVQTVDPTASRRRVFLFGGSTMWGVAVRDAYTIPSQVASRLRTRGITDVEVVNMGQSGFNFTQGAVSLLLSLRDGDIPVAVVFLDGVNDISSAFISGRAGELYNQDLIAQVFRERQAGPLGHLRALVRQSALVRGLSRSLELNARRPAIDLDQACRALASQYHDLGQSVAAMGDALGFQTALIWQPMVATTMKEPTPWEHQLMEHPAPEIGRLSEMMRRCTTLVDSVMGGPAAPTYRNFGPIFDSDRDAVFLDHYGHVTERANGIIADSIVVLVEARLRR